MTMTISRLIEAARALVPGRVVVAVEQVRAFRWLAVEPPATVTLLAKFDGVDRVSVAAQGYTEATVVLGEHRPHASAPSLAPLRDPHPAAIDAAALYRDHWMFHGPSYQAVRELASVGKDGIRGELEVLPAEGALLDNVGQLFGYWIMEHADRDRLAMPVKVERIAFFGEEPVLGERVTCDVRVRAFGAREVRADMEVLRGGRVWVSITGWEDWRFESDARLWPVVREPERHLYAQPREEGAYLVIGGAGRTPAARDYLSRRFLCEAERADFAAVAERGQRAWLLGRIAAKDAAREYLWRHDAERRPLFPSEVAVYNDDVGRPVLSGPRVAGLCVSIAHKDELAVARVGRCPVGIDVEAIVARPDSFGETAFTEAERALVAGRSRDEWWTRLWCAKEAVGKALGTGLGGAPAKLPLEAVDGERLRCAGRWVETRVEGGFVVAWTGDDEA